MFLFGMRHRLEDGVPDAGVAAGGGGTAPAAPAAPAADGGGSAQPQATATPPAAPQAQPQASSSEGEVTPPAQTPAAPVPGDEPDPVVPWAKFREVNKSFTQARRQFLAEKAQWGEKLSAAEQQIRDLEGFREDVEAFESFLDANPDVRDQVKEFLQAQASGRPVQRRAAAPVASPEVAKLQEQIQQLQAQVQGAQRAQMQAGQAEASAKLRQELNTMVQGELSKRGLENEFTDLVVAHIAGRVAQDPSLEPEDVPMLFLEWYRPLAKMLHKQNEALRAGKAADNRLPAEVPGAVTGQPPLSAKEEMGALDDTTNERLAKFLMERGWNNNGQPAQA